MLMERWYTATGRHDNAIPIGYYRKKGDFNSVRERGFVISIRTDAAAPSCFFAYKRWKRSIRKPGKNSTDSICLEWFFTKTKYTAIRCRSKLSDTVVLLSCLNRLVSVVQQLPPTSNSRIRCAHIIFPDRAYLCNNACLLPTFSTCIYLHI